MQDVLTDQHFWILDFDIKKTVLDWFHACGIWFLNEQKAWERKHYECNLFSRLQTSETSSHYAFDIAQIRITSISVISNIRAPMYFLTADI